MTPAGIIMALGAIVVSMLMDGGQPTALIKLPALLLVVGGTIGATIAGGVRKDALRMPKALLLAFRPKYRYDAAGFAEHLITLARDARTGGLKVLERELPEAQEDAFVRTGVELIATTSDPDRVRQVLEAEIMAMRDRHRTCWKAYAEMAGFAPTIGILGTVIGLVRVLGNLTSPGKLGPAIASAFTATLWGVLSANIIWLPISNKLKRLSEEETRYKALVIEGLLAVQEGLSGPQLRDRLVPYLPPEDREQTVAATGGVRVARGDAAA
ncbi:MAG: MotA/TolQ/ExbB proton channel [Acidimicrobiaceae bacterium]|nr:MotA/TolQ/ExbB proton channel [Acidimicrobiaceae bacterium]